MPSRMGEYEEFLRQFLDLGYVFRSHRDIADLPSANFDKRIAMIRHDIDVDVATARKMYEVETRLGLRTSYYFRLSTLDFALMRSIAESGSEVGYHYEELATYCKRNGIRSREHALACMSAIQDDFRYNLAKLRQESRLPIRTIASHGDFANRFLSMANRELIDDQLRHELGVELEAYDMRIGEIITQRYADRGPPNFWSPFRPTKQHIDKDDAIVCVLVHPNHWSSNIRSNICENVTRCLEGSLYFVRRSMANHKVCNAEPSRT